MAVPAKEKKLTVSSSAPHNNGNATLLYKIFNDVNCWVHLKLTGQEGSSN